MFKSILRCPYLQGAEAEAMCDVNCNFVTNIEDADIRLCMGRHYEACTAYQDSLKSLLFAKYAGAGE